MLKFRTAVLCTALSASCLVGYGCGDKKMTDTSMSGSSNMSKDDMMKKGQEMMDQGNASKATAGNMPAGPMKDDMMSKAQKMIDEGKAMMDKAKM